MATDHEAVGDWTTQPHRYLGRHDHPAHLGVSCWRYQEGERAAVERRVQTVAVDFDGVIHRYSRGWHDGTIYDEPEPGAIDGIRKLQQEYAVYVHTSRDPASVAAWLINHGVLAVTMSAWVDERPEDHPWAFWGNQELVLVTGHKLPAVAYLDDRAVPFVGWPAVLLQIHSLTRFKGSPPALAVASDADWQLLEEGEVVNHILRGAPESWAEDAAPGHIATAYVRELERRLDAAGISRERDAAETVQESDGQFLARVGTDAQAWAYEFMTRVMGLLPRDAKAFDPGMVLGWFANAIEAGRSAGRVSNETAARYVFMAMGEASVCWNPRPEGVFDSEAASRVGERLLLQLGHVLPEAYRGAVQDGR